MQIASDKRFKQFTDRVAARLLPQFANIVIPSRVPDDSGMVGNAGNTMTYNGDTSIPCRLDASMHYRQADVFEQETIVSEFTANFPRDLILPLDAVVWIEGQAFEIRKVLDVQAWDVTCRALLVRAGDAARKGFEPDDYS